MLLSAGFLEHLKPVRLQLHDLAWSQVVHGGIVEIGKTRRLSTGRIGTVFLSNDDGRTATNVARGDDAIFCEDKHRARALYLVEYLIDAIHKRGAHIDEQGHQFGLIDLVGRHLAEMHALGQQLMGDFGHVVDLGHGDHGKAPQVRVDDDGLGIGVADHTNTLASMKLIELVFKLRTEIISSQAMDRPAETFLRVESSHTCTACAEMRVVVCAIKQVVDTVTHRNCPKKTSH